MKVLDGINEGKKAIVYSSLLGGSTIQISASLFKVEKYNMPKDFESIKLIHKENGKTTGQKLIIIILALTMIGIPLALLLAWLWQGATFTVGMTTKEGSKFALKGEGSEWTHFKKYIGKGEVLEY
jgi:hypothetical protein